MQQETSYDSIAVADDRLQIRLVCTTRLDGSREFTALPDDPRLDNTKDGKFSILPPGHVGRMTGFFGGSPRSVGATQDEAKRKLRELLEQNLAAR